MKLLSLFFLSSYLPTYSCQIPAEHSRQQYLFLIDIGGGASPCKRESLDLELNPCCCCSVTKSCPTLTTWTAAGQSPLHSTIFWSMLKLMSIESVMPSNHLILCHPILHLPSLFASIRVFSNDSALHIRWPKYWSFSFSISPSKEYSGLISFRIDWFALHAVQGTLKSILQHHHYKNINSFLYCPTLTSIHDYWKICTFVGKVMSLLFNTLSMFVKVFLPRSMCRFILWLQSKSAVILEPKKIKTVTASTSCPSLCHEVMGSDATILVFFNVEFQASFFTLFSHPH